MKRETRNMKNNYHPRLGDVFISPTGLWYMVTSEYDPERQLSYHIAGSGNFTRAAGNIASWTDLGWIYLEARQQ